MFKLDGTTITMSRGDTGAILVKVSGYNFASADRVLFTVRDSAGEIVLQRVYEIEDSATNVTFFNADTDALRPGQYSWDMRYVIHPYYDDDENIIDGDQVITPNKPMKLNLLSTVGAI